jgi:hypothetical protein
VFYDKTGLAPYAMPQTPKLLSKWGIGSYQLTFVEVPTTLTFKDWWLEGKRCEQRVFIQP